MRGYNANLNQ